MTHMGTQHSHTIDSLKIHIDVAADAQPGPDQDFDRHQAPM